MQGGRRLYDFGYVQDISIDTKTKQIKAFVKSESYYLDTHTVFISFEPEEEYVDFFCDCPYGQCCKHTVAVFMVLSEKFSSGEIAFDINPQDHTIGMESFLDSEIMKITGESLFKDARKLYEGNKNKFELIKPGKFEFTTKTASKEYLVNLSNKKNSNDLETSCSCTDKRNPLCVHKTAAVMQLQELYGKYGLFFTHDYSENIKSLLEQVGLTPGDNYDEVLHFGFDNNKLSAWIHNDQFIHPRKNDEYHDFIQFKALKTLPNSKAQEFLSGYVISCYQDYSRENHISFEAVIGKKAKRGEKIVGQPEVTSMPLSSKIWKNMADSDDYEIARHLSELQEIELQGSHDSLAQKLSVLKTVITPCRDKKIFACKSSAAYERIKGTLLNPVYLSDECARAKIICKEKEAFISLKFQYSIAGKKIKLKNHYDKGYFLVEQQDTFHLWASIYDYKARRISNGSNELLIAKNHWDQVWNSWLKELANHIEIDISKKITAMPEVKVTKYQRKVFLKEEGKFLLVYPALAYNNVDVHINQEGVKFFTPDNRFVRRERDKEIELIKLIANTHPSFNEHTFQPFFFLPAEKVLERMWFINFYEVCKHENIEVFGLDNLKKVNYYPARPKVNYSFSSGTDWFDINVKLQYDDYTVSLNDVRKALINRSNYIKLANDKFAMLPEDWMNRFKGAIRFGKISDDGIRMKKSQFALVHDLYDEINDLELQKEFAEKRALLRDFTEIEKIRKPKIITGKLRDYQSEGLNWLGFLYKTSLGGCLADDMGLGKTLQMLSVFAYAKGQNPKKKITHLVVCPTSLIFNWQNEIEKFAPSMKTKIHWGNNRDEDSKDWKKHDIIITTYGTLSNDIEWIRKFSFQIATLDESQAIKNPTSLRFKAVCLIKAKQRFVMTGTPVENSTVELYAQMQFLNPGILGSLNAFRKDFSQSIEKERDEIKINHLRQLVKPFIIRRKKEEVAKELPPKTEQILYCEMDEEQKKVYDAFKKDIHDRIMTKIDDEGINNSRLTVLEGLTKLRQICDSPALLNTDEDYGQASVKADELLRFITRKIRDHKALVFSQFLGMLSLIEARLKKEGIPYVKLTGSTRNRQELVDQFENDSETRVFLISLKAGGTGLNLVSADYVFMVDPWWNPAVENQAIDRTHRIGQTKKVFAYRMICKDTVEEKILNLKKQKQALADDLINSEQGFVKQLSKEDLSVLLS